MKSKLLVVCAMVAFVGSAAMAAIGDVNPAGLTGLWRFENPDNNMTATIGTDMVGSGSSFTGPWTVIEPGLTDGRVVQVSEWGTLQTYHGIAANGGGTKVNEYTVLIDYCQTSDLGQWNALLQVDTDAHGSDAEFWTSPTGQIGVGAVGYSTLTYDPSTWHRIVFSIDNGNFWRAYVDGVLFLDGAGQDVDGRFALNEYFHLFGDNTWGEVGWGLCGTVAVWDRAMGSDEVADLGGWIDGAAAPTALAVVPEPATMALLGLGGLIAVRRKK